MKQIDELSAADWEREHGIARIVAEAEDSEMREAEMMDWFWFWAPIVCGVVVLVFGITVAVVGADQFASFLSAAWNLLVDVVRSLPPSGDALKR
jgi:hypothetical protein